MMADSQEGRSPSKGCNVGFRTPITPGYTKQVIRLYKNKSLCYTRHVIGYNCWVVDYIANPYI